MTRKDYIKIAEVLKNHSTKDKHTLALSFSVMLKQDNDRFNEERFIKAVME